MKEYSTISNQHYADVTSLGGECFERVKCINYACDVPQAITSYMIPKVGDGSRLFYYAG